MKKISENIQEGELLARKSAMGEYGIMSATDNKILNAIWWDDVDKAIEDLEKIIAYFSEIDAVVINNDR